MKTRRNSSFSSSRSQSSEHSSLSSSLSQTKSQKVKPKEQKKEKEKETQLSQISIATYIPVIPIQNDRNKNENSKNENSTNRRNRGGNKKTYLTLFFHLCLMMGIMFGPLVAGSLLYQRGKETCPLWKSQEDYRIKQQILYPNTTFIISGKSSSSSWMFSDLIFIELEQSSSDNNSNEKLEMVFSQNCDDGGGEQSPLAIFGNELYQKGKFITINRFIPLKIRSNRLVTFFITPIRQGCDSSQLGVVLLFISFFTIPFGIAVLAKMLKS